MAEQIRIGTIVQGKVLTEIGKMAEEAEENIVLSLTQTHIKVEIGNTKLTARLLDGNYIDYKRIIPKECKTRVLINVPTLVEMIILFFSAQSRTCFA